MGRPGAYPVPALGELTGPCGFLSPAEQDRLRQAARLMAVQRGLVPRVGAWLGGQAERVVSLLGSGWRERIDALVEEALWRAQDLATFGLDPQGSGPARSWVSRIATTASGAVTGFAGLPGVAVDIPFSTLLILRSIAEIARAEGEDIASEAGKRACLEVLALNATNADEAEMGYWTARLGLGAMNAGALVPQAARMLGTALSEKVLAQAVPVAGAVAGASLNYAFIRYYQSMARVHFTIRAVERAHPGANVRACLDSMVAEMRDRRAL